MVCNAFKASNTLTEETNFYHQLQNLVFYSIGRAIIAQNIRFYILN